MELYESEKLRAVREELFEAAMKHELHKNVIATEGHVVFGRGSDKAKILFIGEAPGFSENEEGKPFVGRSGKLLEEWVAELGLTKEDYAIINVVPIIPLDHEKKIRPPTQQEIDYFFPTVSKMIAQINPEVIVLLGKSAARGFGRESMRVGQTQEFEGRKLHFLYHPAYHLRNGRKGFEDLAQLKKILGAKKEKKSQTTLGSF